MSTSFNALDLIRIILKWKRPLGWMLIASIVLSYVFSMPFFIPPQYKAYTILYPANLTPSGTESTTEQMMQMLQSEDIRRAIMQRFQLMKHYRINPNQRYPRTALNEEYDDHIYFKKTEFESVEIGVFDPSPDTAAHIANAIVELFNNKTRNLHRQKYAENIYTLKNQLARKRNEMDSMELALKNIRMNYGILNYNVQSDVQSREYIEALMRAGKQGMNSEIKTAITNLEEKGGEFIALTEHLWRVRGSYNDIKGELEAMLKNYEMEQSYAYVITKAFPAEKKSYPSRGLIVLISSIVVLFTSILFILFIENLGEIKKNFSF